MTLIDVITALILLGVFMFGFSQIFFPALNAWRMAVAEYYTAHTIKFIAESFRKECAKTNPNMDDWGKLVAVAKELESYEITKLWHEDQIFALQAVCVISGKRLEILGLCKP